MSNMLGDAQNLFYDIKRLIRNLERMDGLRDLNARHHQKALSDAKDALKGVRVIKEHAEKMDDRYLDTLLQRINLSGDLSVLSQNANEQLESLKNSLTKIRLPNIDESQIEQILTDLQDELTRMKNDAVKKGIGFLATLAKVVISFL